MGVILIDEAKERRRPLITRGDRVANSGMSCASFEEAHRVRYWIIPESDCDYYVEADEDHTLEPI